MSNEGNQIHNYISSSGSRTVINYGSGSSSQRVTVPVPQCWLLPSVWLPSVSIIYIYYFAFLLPPVFLPPVFLLPVFLTPVFLSPVFLSPVFLSPVFLYPVACLSAAYLPVASLPFACLPFACLPFACLPFACLPFACLPFGCLPISCLPILQVPYCVTVWFGKTRAGSCLDQCCGSMKFLCRIRSHGSIPLTNRSGSCYSHQWPFWRYIYTIFRR